MEEVSYWLIYFLILLLGGGALIGLAIWARRTSRTLWLNLSLSLLSLFVTLMGLEFYFKVFFAQPDALPTLANRNWYERYYTGTLNSAGYRDKEWTEADVTGKIKVLVVGDSLVEGVGIERPEDRFPDLLAQKLGPDHVVMNVGRQGANTGDEIQALLDYPYEPDVLIWTYFINDIGDQAGPFGILLPPKRHIPAWVSPLEQNSYAFNFLYWRLYRFFSPEEQFPDAKWRWLVSIYNHPDAWWSHQQQLISISDGARSQRIPLIIVVFPGIPYIEESRFVTERVINLYQERGVPTLDVGELIKDIPVKERMASPMDQHPNERVHALVAEALHGMMIHPEFGPVTENP